jgi:lipid A 4'-phosphatase
MKAAITYLAAFVLTTALFLAFPKIDLLTSGLFYAPGHGFFLKTWAPVETLYHFVPSLARAMALVIAFGAAWLLLGARPLWRLDRKTLCFLSLSMALGPGLVVNAVLKDHWGRARPEQVERFGGTRHFTPAPVPAAECAHNCSFPSGHAALGFSLVAFAFLLPSATAIRRFVAAAAAGLGVLIGLGRIAQGAHYLSDVVYAGLLVYGTTAALHWWVVERDGLAAPVLRKLYRAVGRTAMAAGASANRILMSSTSRLGLGTAAVAIIVIVSIETLDRPLAFFFRARGADFHALFALSGRLGLGYGWLIGFGIGFTALHWGGKLPRLVPFGRRLRAWSPIPAFLFASIAASGLAADILKVLFGRMRPQLLFKANIYGFTWFSWHADHWSFPSGHTTTIVSLMTALWYLWPSHLLFYMVVGTIIGVSRVVTCAHFLSDAIAGAWLAVLTTGGVVELFARTGIDLAAARRGRPPPDGRSPRICRGLRGLAPFRGRFDPE